MEKEFKLCPICHAMANQINEKIKETKQGQEVWRILRCSNCDKKFRVLLWLN